MNPAARILVVDDEPNVRLMVRTGLEIAGYEVVEAPDARQAIDSARAFPPDVVLLDLRLPGVSGLEALEALRQATRDQSPVIVLTAHGSVRDAVAALKLGAADFVTKPLTPEVLRRVVLDALSRRAAGTGGTGSAGSNSAQIGEHLAAAGRALGARTFAEAEAYLRKALALDPNLEEAHRLLALVSTCEQREPALFGGLVDLFPTGRPRARPVR